MPGLPGSVPHDQLHETANAVHSASFRLLRETSRVDNEMILDGPRASLLSIVVSTGPQPVTHLAALEQVTPPAITRTVGALERAGLVTRERSSDDRRVVLVAATAKGRRLLERGQAARVRAVARRLDRMSDRDLATLRRAATLLAGVL